MRTNLFRFYQLLLVFFVSAMGLMAVDTGRAQESAKTKTFVVIGTAAVRSDDVSAAREKAIADSLVTAVALTTQEILQVESLVENFAQLNQLLFDQTSEFVRDYKVLTETAQGKSYRVIVQATVLGNKISSRLSEAGILLAEKKLPSVLLLIAEQNPEDLSPRYWWGQNGDSFEAVSETSMLERLTDAGFAIVAHRGVRNLPNVDWSAFDKPDLTDEQASQLGASLNADVVVVGTAIASPSTNIMGSDMRSFNGTVAARVIRAGTAEPMLQLTRTAVAVNEDDIFGSREALADAGDLAGQALAEELAVVWQKQAGKPSVVEMVIRGTGHLANYVKFRKALNTISGVEGIRVKGIKPNEATLLVEYKGKPKDLAAALMLQNFGSFGINIFEITQDMLKVELIPG